MNVNEFGQTIRANIGEDVSSLTSYKMILEPELGVEVEKDATLGTVNIVVGDETFIANRYVEYVVEEKVLDRKGQWRKKGKATSATQEISGNYQRFTVLA